MELTIVQALRLLKTIREEQSKEIGKIGEAVIPTKVDGEDRTTLGRKEESLETIEKVKDLTSDIIHLRNAIDESNKENGLNEVTNELQELRKLEHRLDNMEMYSFRDVGKIEVSDNGNLIEYELLSKEQYETLKDKVKKDSEELQDKLDKANSENTITIELKTR